MARKVEWTDPAWEDLADIVDYIARDSVYYAAAFVQEVKDTAASLTDFANVAKSLRNGTKLLFESC